MKKINPRSNLFTTKELMCIDLFLQGYSNKEIASILKLSPRTIEDKIDNLKIKIKAKSRVDLAIKLYEIVK
ncbi:helix-turn-helix transcriptional regulator [Legionella micdadei]|uniref:helix-turn-helix transcriptional regulator n=1 Tax=Legionella micdadei TaxID=451 RepID=UPI00115F889F|nr:helix-turn-helix transcriptional regulator [Legionella micdadei]